MLFRGSDWATFLLVYITVCYMSHTELCSPPLSSTGSRLASPQLFLSSCRPWLWLDSTTYSPWPQRPSFTWPSLRSATTGEQTSLLQLPYMQITKAVFCIMAHIWRIQHAWFIYCLCFFSFPQLMLGVPEQALSVLHEAIEPVLAHGAVMDKGRALLLTARCQMAVAGFRPNRQGQAGNSLGPPCRILIPIS